MRGADHLEKQVLTNEFPVCEKFSISDPKRQMPAHESLTRRAHDSRSSQCSHQMADRLCTNFSKFSGEPLLNLQRCFKKLSEGHLRNPCPPPKLFTPKLFTPSNFSPQVQTLFGIILRNLFCGPQRPRKKYHPFLVDCRPKLGLVSPPHGLGYLDAG